MEPGSDIHVQAAEQDTTPRVKQRPAKSSIPVPFIYHASDDGTDENLLILLHGIGECCGPNMLPTTSNTLP